MKNDPRYKVTIPDSISVKLQILSISCVTTPDILLLITLMTPTTLSRVTPSLSCMARQHLFTSSRGVMEEVNAESEWKEVKGKEAQLVNDDSAENWRSNGKARLVPTSNSCSDSRMINFAAARTCISADALQWDALVMATVTVLLPNKDPDTELIPSWLVVEMEVLEEDQVRWLSPPVSVCFTV